MIKVAHMSYSFGPLWALKDITFALAKGEFLFLSGPSGAGKTTLLRTLYGALPLQRGEARIAGFTLGSKLTPKQVALLRRDVSVVFQDFKILPDRTVWANIALALEVRGLAPVHVERRVRAVAKALGLDGRLHTLCGELSGGEQQRVAVARSFVVNPRVLLADEPTGNLDPDLSLRLMDLFMQFQAYGTTIIFATHSHELLRRHPTARLLRLEDGMVTYANWPGAILARRAEHEEKEMIL
ncbi:transporter subunit: ATP-binding component of ABC superfamily [uncultured delta proteobacterium]|uniref:Transporter subunit: ATP-binding component of ABC superfamily n=1 Tax=uncultured delta proteobacterium TaxID=34034 RepID=A0A212JYY1_9DELT|nr:transporter subunit: ATP-binding component of ABC superfamily [uncultured delta proteobacterium]